MEKKELRRRIKDNYHCFSKGKRKLADFILEHYEQAAFLTAARLGEAVGVSESTAVRFALDLGYSGYPELQRELEQLVTKQLHTVRRMEETYGDLRQPEILTQVLQGDMQRIGATLRSIDGQSFEEALDILEHARRIYIVGLRGCAPVASYLSLYLKLIFEDVVLLNSSSEHELLEQMIYVGGRDAVVGISFPRYSMRTLKLLEFANSRQASVITLTDSIHAPVNLYSSCNLVACSDMSSVVDSMVAPMSVVNAMLTALCLRHKKKVLKNLDLIGQTLEDYQMFGNDEMELPEDCVELKPFHYGEGKPEKERKGKTDE